ncbi:MAG: Pr6Pr family membrane protein [Acidimicrobiia bacterium]
MSTRAARSWKVTIALLVTAAIAVQIWIAIRVSATPAGHAVGTLAGTATANRALRVLSFFTIQSNILSGITSGQPARNSNRDGRVWRTVRLASLFGITVTGIVYATVLAKVHEPHGWQETTTNAAFHYIVPIMMLVGWLVFGPRRRIDRRTITFSIMWPIGWTCYIVSYGRITKWYPYPFVDVVTHGYGRVALNAGAVVAVLLGVTSMYWLGDRYLRATPHISSSSTHAAVAAD